MTPKAKKIYYYIVGALFSIIGIAIIYQFISAMSESEMPVYKTKQEYLELFNDSSKSQLKDVVSYNSKKRNSIGILNYDKGKYCLIIYKIPIVKDFMIDNVFISQEDNEYHPGAVYTVINMSYFEVFYASGKPNLANEIHFSYEGSSFQTVITNDSMTVFYFKYKNLALRYNEERTIDIHSRIGNIYNPVPTSMLFLKRNGSVYLVMMSVNDPKHNLDPKLLYTLMR